jgi:hypothetical protein
LGFSFHFIPIEWCGTTRLAPRAGRRSCQCAHFRACEVFP